MLLLPLSWPDFRFSEGDDSRLEVIMQVTQAVSGKDSPVGTAPDVIAWPQAATSLGLDPEALDVPTAVRASLIQPDDHRPHVTIAANHLLIFSGLGEGGALPVGLFDRESPSWPTFGIRLIDAESPPPHLSPADAARTIDVPVSAELGKPFASIEELGSLYGVGREAARRFLTSWRFEEYLEERSHAGPTRTDVSQEAVP